MSNPQTQPLVQVLDVHKSFPMGGQQVTALRGVSFDIGRGEFLAIVGASGAG